MWAFKYAMKCPVCFTILGRRDKDVAASFECGECKWVFYWDADGTLLAPKKPPKEIKRCGCGGCTVSAS